MIAAALCAMIRRAAHGPMGVTATVIVEKAQAEAPVADLDRFSISPFGRRAGRWAAAMGGRSYSRSTRCGRKGLDCDGEERYFITSE
jgi:hypothetical protein